jgi:hypothetical protein
MCADKELEKLEEVNIMLIHRLYTVHGAPGTVVGWGTTLQPGRSWVRISMRLLDVSIDPFLPAALALGLTQPLTEMSTRNLPGGKGRPARRADNLTAICDPIV